MTPLQLSSTPLQVSETRGAHAPRHETYPGAHEHPSPGVQTSPARQRSRTLERVAGRGELVRSRVELLRATPGQGRAEYVGSDACAACHPRSSAMCP